MPQITPPCLSRALPLGADEDAGATAPDWMPEASTYRFDFKS
jgi:hypothetical protein